MEFALDRDEFRQLVALNCSYCGSAPSFTVTINCPGHPEFRYNGIDRVDNTLGYVSGNCITACLPCNQMKSFRSRDDFIAQVRRIHEFSAGELDLTVGAQRYASYVRDFNSSLHDIRSKASAPLTILAYDYKMSAKRRGFEFALSKDVLAAITQSDCFYCGVQPSRIVRHYSAFRWNGIDRTDNVKGYVEGNVVPCCGPCNEMKSDKSREEFLRLVAAVYRHLRSSLVI